MIRWSFLLFFPLWRFLLVVCLSFCRHSRHSPRGGAAAGWRRTRRRAGRVWHRVHHAPGARLRRHWRTQVRLCSRVFIAWQNVLPLYVIWAVINTVSILPHFCTVLSLNFPFLPRIILCYVGTRWTFIGMGFDFSFSNKCKYLNLSTSVFRFQTEKNLDT